MVTFFGIWLYMNREESVKIKIERKEYKQGKIHKEMNCELEVEKLLWIY